MSLTKKRILATIARLKSTNCDCPNRYSCGEMRELAVAVETLTEALEKYSGDDLPDWEHPNPDSAPRRYWADEALTKVYGDDEEYKVVSDGKMMDMAAKAAREKK